MSRAVYVGIDVGGTKIAAAAVDMANHEIIEYQRVDTETHLGGLHVLETCIAAAADLAKNTNAAGIGVGLCEHIDRARKVATWETVDWRNLDPIGRLSRIRPAVLESDVRAAAVAEAVAGAGLGAASFLYVTVGTGISQCLVIDGVPFPGAHGHAIVLGAPPVERTASGRALAGARSEHTERLLSHPDAHDSLELAARRTGRAVAALVNALDPGLVVIGGGLGLVPRYLDRLTGAVLEQVEDLARAELSVVPAAFGEHAGVIGAAIVAGRLVARRSPAGFSAQSSLRR